MNNIFFKSVCACDFQLLQLAQQQQQTSQTSIITATQLPTTSSNHQQQQPQTIQMLPQGAVLLQSPNTNNQLSNSQPQVLFLNSTSFQPQFLLPATQVCCSLTGSRFDDHPSSQLHKYVVLYHVYWVIYRWFFNWVMFTWPSFQPAKQVCYFLTRSHLDDLLTCQLQICRPLTRSCLNDHPSSQLASCTGMLSFN